MRILRDFLLFVDHPEWYTIDKEKGYVPTDEAPEEIVEAIKRFNEDIKHGKIS